MEAIGRSITAKGELVNDSSRCWPQCLTTTQNFIKPFSEVFLRRYNRRTLFDRHETPYIIKSGLEFLGNHFYAILINALIAALICSGSSGQIAIICCKSGRFGQFLATAASWFSCKLLDDKGL